MSTPLELGIVVGKTVGVFGAAYLTARFTRSSGTDRGANAGGGLA